MQPVTHTRSRVADVVKIQVVHIPFFINKMKRRIFSTCICAANQANLIIFRKKVPGFVTDDIN